MRGPREGTGLVDSTGHLVSPYWLLLSLPTQDWTGGQLYSRNWCCVYNSLQEGCTHTHTERNRGETSEIQIYCKESGAGKRKVGTKRKWGGMLSLLLGLNWISIMPFSHKGNTPQEREKKWPKTFFLSSWSVKSNTKRTSPSSTLRRRPSLRVMVRNQRAHDRGSYRPWTFSSNERLTPISASAQ